MAKTKRIEGVLSPVVTPFKRDYAPGTFREKLFGRGPRLPASHPAAAVRVTR